VTPPTTLPTPPSRPPPLLPLADEAELAADDAAVVDAADELAADEEAAVEEAADVAVLAGAADEVWPPAGTEILNTVVTRIQEPASEEAGAAAAAGDDSDAADVTDADDEAALETEAALPVAADEPEPVEFAEATLLVKSGLAEMRLARMLESSAEPVS
jgi:hypothetical protein